MREVKFHIFRHDKIQGNIGQVLRNNICLRSPKFRSQISRRADDSFPVFARPLWHAGHADREASWVWHARHVGRHAGHEIGKPSMTDFDVRFRTIS